MPWYPSGQMEELHQPLSLSILGGKRRLALAAICLPPGDWVLHHREYATGVTARSQNHQYFLCMQYVQTAFKQTCYCLKGVHVSRPQFAFQQDWWDVGQNGAVRTLPEHAEVENPFKSGVVSPLRQIPHVDCPKRILIDVAHTHAICGFGKDDCASALVFLSCRYRLWGGNTIPKRLELAYDSFQDYCVKRGKTTSIMEFTYQDLKIKSTLASTMW